MKHSCQAIAEHTRYVTGENQSKNKIIRTEVIPLMSGLVQNIMTGKIPCFPARDVKCSDKSCCQ